MHLAGLNPRHFFVCCWAASCNDLQTNRSWLGSREPTFRKKRLRKSCFELPPKSWMAMCRPGRDSLGFNQLRVVPGMTRPGHGMQGTQNSPLFIEMVTIQNGRPEIAASDWLDAKCGPIGGLGWGWRTCS